MSSPPQPPTSSTPLLDLPRELRNAIYKCSLDDDSKPVKIIVLPKALTIDGKQVTMVAVEPFSAVCKQLRAEYRDMDIGDPMNLDEGISPVVIVQDFDFDNAIDSFFSQLSASDPQSFRTTIITIKIYFTKRFSGVLEPDDLKNSSFLRWIAHRHTAHQQHTDVNVSYKICVEEGGRYDPIRQFLELIADNGTQGAEWRDMFRVFRIFLESNYTEYEEEDQTEMFGADKEGPDEDMNMSSDEEADADEEDGEEGAGEENGDDDDDGGEVFVDMDMDQDDDDDADPDYADDAGTGTPPSLSPPPPPSGPANEESDAEESEEDDQDARDYQRFLRGGW